MKTFEYARPRTVGEAVALLDEHGSEAQLLAGGTDLVIELRNGWKEPKVVVDLKRIEELRSKTKKKLAPKKRRPDFQNAASGQSPAGKPSAQKKGRKQKTGRRPTAGVKKSAKGGRGPH